MKQRFSVGFIAVGVMALVTRAHAALGGLPEPGGVARSKSTVSAMPTDGYAVNEWRSAAGTAVREFVGADGKVFAVSWSGPFMPDLQLLLGDYFAHYAEAARQKRPFGRHPMALNNGTLVVHAGGHMRSYAGYAYLAGKMPADTSPETFEP